MEHPVRTSVGFTGTQQGMTDLQKYQLALRIEKLILENGAIYFHHGDCIGADEESHHIAIGLGLKVIVHPCDINAKRAYCTLNVEFCYSSKPPLDRNKDIVNQSDILLAAPKGRIEELRSGTWSTVRFAKKQKKPFEIINPY